VTRPDNVNAEATVGGGVSFGGGEGAIGDDPRPHVTDTIASNTAAYHAPRVRGAVTFVEAP
jgi:hypothetical protein